MPELPRPADTSLRVATEADLDVLFEIYASTRTEELAVVPWTDAQKEAFLRMQFQAQHQYYRQTYPDARFDVIVHGDTPVGRLYVDRREDEIRLIDIALLPAHRARGIGSALLGELLAEAERAGKPVRIHVEHNNPARRLYERLGFRPLEDRGVYLFMEWAPPARPEAAS